MGEINRLLKPSGILGVVDFKKIEGSPGPPMSIRLSWDEAVSIIAPFGYQMGTRDADVGIYSYAITLTKM